MQWLDLRFFSQGYGFVSLTFVGGAANILLEQAAKELQS